MKTPILLLLAAMLLPVTGPHAQTARRMIRPRPHPRPLPPPVLMVRRQERSVPLQMTRLNIEARVVGHLARTTMTMTFHNPNNRVVEGNLYFPLPEGATVSGYALDANGRMVDGVVIDKDRGRQVFETEVRKGIDPGLVEWTKGQNFQTRIYPIGAKGSRTVSVTYVADVEQTPAGATYRLPLAFRKKIGAFSLRVEVVKAAAKPIVAAGGPGGLAFGAWRDSYVASTKGTGVTLNKDLRITLPRIEKTPVRVEKAPDGGYYFTIRDTPAVPAAQHGASPRHLVIYWDASLSRAGADHEKELKLLGQYLDTIKDSARVSLVLFRNAPEKTRRFALPADSARLLSVLRAVKYDGGTQAGTIPRVTGQVDVVLLFSDGLSTFGEERPPALGAPVFAINVSSSANHAFMRYLALRSGGAYINLARTPLKAALASIGAGSFSFISAKVTGCNSCSLYPRVPEPVHGPFAVAGRLTTAMAQVTVNYGIRGRVTHSQTFTVNRSDAVAGNLLRRAWAQKKLDDLLIFPERNRDEIATLGKEFSLVTPMTSLIVLETLAQYVEHRIRPPASLPGMAAKYDKAVAQLTRKKRLEEDSKLARVIRLWQDRLTWYNTRFKRYHKIVEDKKGYSGGSYGMSGRVAAMDPRASRGASATRRPPAIRSLRRRASSDAAPMERSLGKAKNKSAAEPEATITMQAWNPDTPYLKVLKAASRASRYTTYLAQREKHGKAPAFYLDCADFFFKNKQRDLGLRILSNLAELELENPALLRVLAHRLTQLSEYDLGILVFRKVLSLRPEEPQSYRDLALVLERRADRRRGASRRSGALADYSMALQLLSKVVMNKWQRFSEIEVIALTELNNILPRAKKLGLAKLPVDKRLIKQLTLDVRIVMTWDADLTDMDLHVIEPSGEEAYYAHNRTVIGGLVSRDFTQGYGPEVYAIRRAMRGAYKIRTKYYGSSAAKLSGAVTLQVDVYTNYGRPNQRRRSITLRLTKSKEEFLVGTIRF